MHLSRFSRKKVKAVGLLLASLVAFSLANQARAQLLLAQSGTTNFAGGSNAILWLHLLNLTDQEIAGEFPAQIQAVLRFGAHSNAVTIAPQNPSEARQVTIRPHQFARREYIWPVPEQASGAAVLDFGSPSLQALALEITPGIPTNPPPASPRSPRVARFLREAEAHDGEYAASDFFKEHFSGYEPFYFLASTETPNAKFQISFKYQLVNSFGALGTNVPPLLGIYLGYTQTSLWDWNDASAAFFDTSYKPELIYLWEQVDRGKWASWVHLDLQGALQHESNGRDGTDSRSLNIAYLRPTLTLGAEDGFQVKLSPRAWVYLGGLEENPDLKDYRGYVDLRLTVGWARGLQLATTARMGDDWRNGSVQLDLTYPMMSFFRRSFSVYLHAQYFNGYGESLILYNENGSSFRVGFSIYR